jgi:hypothetical protein
MKYAIIIGALLLPSLAHADVAPVYTCVQSTPVSRTLSPNIEVNRFSQSWKRRQSDIAQCNVEESIRAANRRRTVIDMPLLYDPEYNGK